MSIPQTYPPIKREQILAVVGFANSQLFKCASSWTSACSMITMSPRLHEQGDTLGDVPLLTLAQKGFEVLVTIDGSLEFQQNLVQLRTSVIVVHVPRINPPTTAPSSGNCSQRSRKSVQATESMCGLGRLNPNGAREMLLTRTTERGCGESPSRSLSAVEKKPGYRS